MNKLELHKINKHYGKKKHALCDFSFTFTNGIYGLLGPNVPKEPRILQYRFKKVLKDCGIRDVLFHSLRHTYASLCIKKGFDAKALSELLGHLTVNLTLDRYVHTSDEIKKSYVSGLLLT